MTCSFAAADTTESYGTKVSSRLLCGISLDCSNRYYSASDIRQYIDLVSAKANGYVQLHFTGDANVGIECEYLGQTADSNVWQNIAFKRFQSRGKSFSIRIIVSE